MGAKQVLGSCRLCGCHTKLTFEHVPPKAAFNGSSLLRASLTDWLAQFDETQVRRSKMRKGAGGFTLCERCNNDTGQWYVPAYVDWAHQGMRFALAGGSSLDLPFRVFPGRIAKQIVCMFASANGAGFVRNAPELRKYVLDKDARGIPPRFRLYCYLMSPKSRASRQTGVVARFRGSGFDLLSEIAFRPFGYVMTFDQQAAPERGLTDITFFTHHAAGDYRELHLPMPLREVQTYFPTDFRTDAEWKQAKASAQRDHDADAEQNSDK